MVVINFLIGYTSYLALHKIYQWWYGEPRIQNTPVVAPIENKLLDRMAVNWAFGHNRTSITRKREIGAGFYYFDQNVHVPGGHVAVKNVPNVAGGGNIAVYNGQLGERSSCDPIPIIVTQTYLMV